MTRCPQCQGTSLSQSSKFDGTVIDAEEVQHDFECEDCGCLFNIIYAPIATRIFERGTKEEAPVCHCGCPAGFEQDDGTPKCGKHLNINSYRSY